MTPVERIRDLHERILAERDVSRAYTMIRLARKFVRTGGLPSEVSERQVDVERHFKALLHERGIDEVNLKRRIVLLTRIEKIHADLGGISDVRRAVSMLSESRSLLSQLQEVSKKITRRQQDLEQIILQRWGKFGRGESTPTFPDLESKLIQKQDEEDKLYDDRTESTSVHTVGGGLPTLGRRR